MPKERSGSIAAPFFQKKTGFFEIIRLLLRKSHYLQIVLLTGAFLPGKEEQVLLVCNAC